MGVVDEEVSVDTTANATLLRHYTFVFKRPGSGELNTIALSRDPKTSSFGIEVRPHGLASPRARATGSTLICCPSAARQAQGR